MSSTSNPVSVPLTPRVTSAGTPASSEEDQGEAGLRALWVTDTRGVVTFATGGGIAGLPPLHASVGRPIEELFAGSPVLLEIVRSSLGGREANRRLESEGHVLEVRCAPLREPRSGAGGCMGVVIDATDPDGPGGEALGEPDISARARAEAALRESEASYRELFELSNDALFVHDASTGALLDVNQRASELHGHSAEEFKRLGLAAIATEEPPYSPAEAAQQLAKAAAGEPQLFEWKVRHRDGRPIWVEVSLQAVTIGGQQRILATSRDITERRAAEEALQRARQELEERVEQRTAELAKINVALEEEITERERAEAELRQKTSELEGIFRTLPDVYLRVETDGTILDYKPGSEPDQGSSLDLVGRAIQDTLPLPVARQLQDAMAEVLQSRKLKRLEYAMDADGAQHDVEARVLPLTDRQVIIILRDISDRKRAERALQRSEEHFRLLIENSSDIATILGPDGMNRYQSSSITRILGYQPEELLGTSAFRRIHPDDIPVARKVLTEVFQNPGTTRSAEFRYRRKDGVWRVLEARARTLLPDSPNAGVIVNSRDITERKEAERALDTAKKQLEGLLNTIPDLAWLKDTEHRILAVNEAFARAAGMRWEEIIGKTDFDIWPEEQARKFRSDDERVLRDGQQLVLEEYYDGPDGERHWVETIKSPYRDHTGNIAGTAGVGHDITDRKATEEVLRESEERFRSMIENGSDLISILSLDGEIRYESPSVLAILGYTAEEMVGKNAFDYLHPDDVAPTAERYARVASNPGTSESAVFRFRHKNGSWRIVEAIGKLLSPTAPEEGVVVNSRDITERERFQEALEQAKEDAERANRAKSEFLSRMSHELRTPLNSILGFGQLLTRDEVTPAQRKAVDNILKAGHHLLALIDEVLDIARIEANQQRLSVEPVKLAQVVQEALTLIRPLAAQHEVVLEAAPELGDRYVRADRQRLVQVLLNLLSNAVKYNRPGGRAGITWDIREPEEGVEGARIRLSVHDTGRGIPSDRIDELFIPFARLGAEQYGVEGTGLGLALSKALIEAMDGQMSAESRPGEGSTFSVELPLTLAPDPHAAERKPDGADSALDAQSLSGTVLYIEDNAANLSLVEAILECRPKIRLVPATSAQAGLQLAREGDPDLILLDLHLPDLPGSEVLQRLKDDERTRSVPVVVVSADATRGTPEALKAMGASGYLTKPIDIDELLETVDEVLRAAVRAPGSD